EAEYVVAYMNCPQATTHSASEVDCEVQLYFLLLHEITLPPRTTGGAFFLGSRLISWLSKKQSCTSLSTIESGIQNMLQQQLIIHRYY
ncbi:hypothetical protein ACR2V2_26085, partial [Klebsiella pneumoniae]